MDTARNTPKRQNPLEPFFERSAPKTNPFEGNRSAEYLYSRAERVCAAVFLLTSHISPGEPIRKAARNEALTLVELALSLRREFRSQSSNQVAALRSNLRFLITLVRTLAVSGFVSWQNAGILMDSLDELGNFLVSAQRSSFSEGAALSKADLDIPDFFIGHVETRSGRQRDIKDTDNIKDIPTDKDITKMSNSGLSDSMSVRRKSIMEVLRAGGGNLGIRDICSNVPQYSEKMVQRELAELVSAGAVEKTGAKRWSRYSLVKGLA